MAGLDEETDIGIHEGYLHGHLATIGENSSAIAAAPLDEAEDVVPSRLRKVNYGYQARGNIMAYRPQFNPDECSLSSNKISSIWKAAGRVSMSTVPRTVP